ncbi:ribosome-binding protein 1/Meckel syndrome type 1 protein [Xanthomonas arboricola]|uniref:hypothetical protein n=1 Tax=Xanthomonas euroxanthea TaxID=2259622 RepID=UPI00141AB8FF|nr:hypothetical protein [Xanthomonas euroxanthea]NIK06872.1 ribosome-binding protein 1/Meckel syndrome type 1 protein [Xanthomonas euroxanthea]
MTPEELIKQREQRKLLARAAEAKTTGASDDEKIVSDATKENLKSAGRLAASFGKTVAEKTKHAAALAAEKGREAQEAMARRAEEAKAKKDADAAEQARLEAERARELAEQMVHAQAEAQAVEDSSIPSEPTPTTPAPLVTDVARARAEKPEATSASDADVVMSPPAPGVREVEETARPEQAAVEPQVPEVQGAAPSKPTQPLVSAGKPVPTNVAAKPHGRQTKPVTSSPATSAQVNASRGWQRVAGAGVVVLVLAGAMAWWFSHRSSDAASDPRIDATVGVTVPEQIPALAVPVLPAPPTAGVVPAVIVLQEEKPPIAPSVSEVPKAASPPKVEAAAVVPAVMPLAVTRADAAPVSTPKPRATQNPVPKAEPKNDWQDQANNDIDAWAEKSR